VSNNLKCPDCKQQVDALYLRNDGKFVCFDCLPDEEIDLYPGWRKREVLRRKNARSASQDVAKGES